MHLHPSGGREGYFPTNGRGTSFHPFPFFLYIIININIKIIIIIVTVTIMIHILIIIIVNNNRWEWGEKKCKRKPGWLETRLEIGPARGGGREGERALRTQEDSPIDWRCPNQTNEKNKTSQRAFTSDHAVSYFIAQTKLSKYNKCHIFPGWSFIVSDEARSKKKENQYSTT